MPERLLAGALLVPFVLAAASTPADRSEVLFRFNDPQVVESSGLALVDGLVVTTNDSGDSGRVFAVDPKTGNTVGTTQWATEATDVEALAPGRGGTVWVADIGDNAAARDSVRVTRVPVGRGDRSSDGPSYELVYPGGPRDAESLLADPGSGRLYIVTKEVFGGTFWAAPKKLSTSEPNQLERIDRVGDALPLATDAAFSADGRHLVVRGYTVARIYEFPSLAGVATVDLPGQKQGEGLAVDERGRLLLSSEGARSEVLRVKLPRGLREVLAPPGPSPAPTATPSPTDPPASSAPTPREDAEPDPTSTTSESRRPAWPWLVAGLVGVAVVVVLMRSLRPR